MPRPTSERLIQHSTPHIQHHAPLSWILVKNLCRDFARTRAPNRPFCGMLPPEMIPAIAVSHLSHHETCQTETRKASFRLAFRHLWHCEKASFATPNTKNHQPSITSTTQPPDHQPITKTRQESRICAKSLSREKQTCSFRYRLLRKLPLTPTACSAPPNVLKEDRVMFHVVVLFPSFRIWKWWRYP